MIRQDIEIYAIGKGFVKPEDLTIGDQVYTLDHWDVKVAPVESMSSEFISQKINVINSGQNNVEATDDARYLYGNGFGKSKLVSWSEIPVITPNKISDPRKFVPILSWPAPGARVCSDAELEEFARRLAYGKDAYNYSFFYNIIDRLTGQDAQVLVDMLEFWVSESPGGGRFDRVSVKARTHRVYDKTLLDELCRAVLLSGFTAAVTQISQYAYALKVNYESTPIPGSVPKNEKYFKRYYIGLMYNINVGNRPIMGRSNSRVFYLPTASILQKEE